MSQTCEQVFCDLNEPLDLKRAQIESSRCFYCYDAPCIEACPTGIDIPSFIRKVGNGNIRGAALDILGANILGGTCSRACPVETLCQQACVREKSEEKPVEIGLLQRFATDEFFKTGEKPYKQAPSTGKKFAVVGAGPAGLAFAHEAAKLGNAVTIYEAKPKSGGLNEYGLAPYKMTNDFAQKEVDFVLSVGGIDVKHSQALGRDFSLEDLTKKYDSVFLGVGLGGANRLGLEGEDADGMLDAAKFIEKIRQTKDLSKIPVGKNVIVIGGGNTAVDIAVQMKRLGAEYVTLVYRRGTEQMGATGHEQEIAKSSGVLLKTWAKPSKIEVAAGQVTGMQFEHTELGSNGKLQGKGDFFTLKADQVFKAIGQTLLEDELKKATLIKSDTKSEKKLSFKNGKIQIDENFQTTLPGVYAGGDCVDLGEDLTVTSVQHGKLAARAVHQKFSGKIAAGGKSHG